MSSSSLGQMMRQIATFSCVYLLRLTTIPTNVCGLYATTKTTAGSVLLATTYIVISASVIQEVSAVSNDNSSSNNNKPQLSAGKLRSLGEVALSERNFSEAESYYNQAIQLEPNVATNYYKLYTVHKRMKSLNSALNDITKAVELLDEDNKNVEWHILKAKLLVNLGRCEEATVEYQVATILLSRSETNDNNNQKNEKKLQETKIAHKQSKECSDLLTNAMKSYQSNNYANAIQYFNQVLSYTLGGDTPDILYMKAQSEYYTEDYYGTVSDTGKILKNYPKHVEAYQLRGEAYFRLSELDMAVKHFREGLKLDPEHKGKYSLCVCLLVFGLDLLGDLWQGG